MCVTSLRPKLQTLSPRVPRRWADGRSGCSKAEDRKVLDSGNVGVSRFRTFSEAQRSEGLWVLSALLSEAWRLRAVAAGVAALGIEGFSALSSLGVCVCGGCI